MSTSRIPRGIRNNNPGNLRHGSRWAGLTPVQGDPAFCTFTDPVYGIRALARVLLNYQRRHRLNTIHEIISRFAPPIENDTAAYVKAVAGACGVEPGSPIDVVKRLPDIIPAIIRHENGGQPYSPEEIRRGIELAA